MSAIQQVMLWVSAWIPRNWLVAEYLLANNSNDTSGNGNNGTDTSMSYSWSEATFNGSSSIVSLPNTSIIKPTWVFSFSWWVNIQNNAAAGTYPTIVQSYSQSWTVAGFVIYQTPSDHPSNPNCLRFIVWKNTWFTLWTDYVEAFSPLTVTWGSWYFFYAEYNWSNISIRVNSTNWTTVSWSSWLAYNTTTYALFWASNHTWSHFWYLNWKVKKARLYNRVLNAAEIAALYADS